MEHHRGLLETLQASVLYCFTGVSWLMVETYQFFSWTAVFLATVLGLHGVVTMVRSHIKSKEKE